MSVSGGRSSRRLGRLIDLDVVYLYNLYQAYAPPLITPNGILVLQLACSQLMPPGPVTARPVPGEVGVWRFGLRIDRSISRD
jgi:hypothetical protein